MKAIIRHELKNYLKNPLYWAGIAVVTVLLFQLLQPYLGIHYFQRQEMAEEVPMENMDDADIMDGYLPCTKEEQMESGYREILNSLKEDLKLTDSEAEREIAVMRDKNMTVDEAAAYLKDTIGYQGAKFYFKKNEIRKGAPEELNAYIRQKVEERPYSAYFAEKFADFAGLMTGFFASVLLAFLFFSDSRRDIYELLHTKPVSAGGYILGKVIGGFSAILAAAGVWNLIFTILCALAGTRAGLPVRLWDIPVATLLYIVPNVLMITCVCTAVALLFKNPLPAIPVLFIYLLYSNMGSADAEGNYSYMGRFLAILVRFPGRFFEISPPPMVVGNQLFLLAASVLLIILSVSVWKRRGMY